MWDVEDSESNLIATYFTVGQYAGASDVLPLTHANNSYIPSSLVKPALEGEEPLLNELHRHHHQKHKFQS